MSANAILKQDVSVVGIQNNIEDADRRSAAFQIRHSALEHDVRGYGRKIETMGVDDLLVTFGSLQK